MKYSLSNRISFDKDGLKFLYIDNFYSQIKSNQFFNHLLNEIPWSQEQINVFGKAIKLPRLTAYFSDKDISKPADLYFLAISGVIATLFSKFLFSETEAIFIKRF